MLFSEGEAAADDHFHNQVIRGSGDTNSDAEVELPVGREVEVNRGKELLLLIPHRIEARDWTERSIIFQASINALREVEADFDVG